MEINKLTKKEMLEAATTVFSKMSQGMTDRDIAQDMGISNDELLALKARMLDLKAEELRKKPIEHTYVEYMLSQLGNVSDLTEMIDQFKNTKQYNAMVGAVRARAEIYDKLMTRGQDCGVIKKVPDRKEIVGGVVVAELSNDDLRKAIVAELTGLSAMAKKYGDDNFAVQVIPSSIHHGPKYELPVVEDMDSEMSAAKREKPSENKNPRSNKARASRVSGGRKIKMRPAPIPTND